METKTLVPRLKNSALWNGKMKCFPSSYGSPSYLGRGNSKLEI